MGKALAVGPRPAPSSSRRDGWTPPEKPEAATRGRKEAGSAGGWETIRAQLSRRKAKATAALERQKPRPCGPG